MNRSVLISNEIIGESLAIKKQVGFIQKAAKSDKNILILGETGTGKNLTAKKIHELSSRWNKPFVAINCANIPEELFEAELFGHLRGAFTGAIRDKLGLVEVAKDGTIFFDEIGDLTLHLQAKILRIIEERELRRIGDTIVRKTHARFIFATNRNLQEEVKKGRFRKDLYYRINVIRFFIPPLKERKEDIPRLVNHMLEKFRKEGESKQEIHQSALLRLMAYSFPGNIRELENIIERACVLAEEKNIREKDLKFDSNLENCKKGSNITPEQFRWALENCRWNKTKAALEIGISRRQFYRLLRKYQISK